MKPSKETKETTQEIESALSSVSEAISGQPLTDEQRKSLIRDLKNNKEAQSAVQAITDSMSGQKVKIKYSPVTGKRYAPNMEYDPETGVKLLELDQ